MSNKAIELLIKMASECNNSGCRSFDSLFYIGYSEDVLIELVNAGYIIMKDDVAGSIELTDNGYAQARN